MLRFAQMAQLLPDPGSSDVAPATDALSNAQIADVLFNIATLLEMQQDNPYRIAAYRHAARTLLAQSEPVTAVIARGERMDLPGVGERLRRKITELVTTGRMLFYDDLCDESLPDDVRTLMAVPHVGPRTALRLVGEFDIHTLEQLLEAANQQRLRTHYGFGPRSERRLAEAALAALLGHQPAA
jgi:DNA polymerase (family 10)